MKVTRAHEIYLVDHIHTICGHTATDSEAHMDGKKHSDTVVFVNVMNEDGFDLLAGKYFVLENDLASGSVICLNGHNLMVDKGLKFLSLNDDYEFTFTDCKGTGSIRHSANTVITIDDSALDINGGKLYLYNATISNLEFDNNVHQNFVQIANGGTLYMENVNLTIIRDNFSKSTSVPVNTTSIVNMLDNTGKLYAINVKTSRVNPGEEGTIAKVVYNGDNIVISTLSLASYAAHPFNSYVIKASGIGTISAINEIQIASNVGDSLLVFDDDFEGRIDTRKIRYENTGAVFNEILVDGCIATISDLNLSGREARPFSLTNNAKLVLIGSTSITNNNAGSSGTGIININNSVLALGDYA